jgi:hypothetical protein
VEFFGLSTKQAMMFQAMMLHVRMTTIAARHVTTIAQQDMQPRLQASQGKSLRVHPKVMRIYLSFEWL